MRDQKNKTIDVAIIGAGVTGAYSAYRLSQDRPGTIELFEAEDRVGGRLWSHHWPEADAMVELGGEAFSPVHAYVTGLVKHLGITPEPHKAFNALNRLYLRNSMLSYADLLKSASFPAHVKQSVDATVRYFVDPTYFTHGDNGKGTLADPFETVGRFLMPLFDDAVTEAFNDLAGAYMARVEDLGKSNGGKLSPSQVLVVMTPELFDLLNRLIRAIEQSKLKTTGGGEVPAYQRDFWSIVVRGMGQESYELFRNAGYDNTSALSFNMVELFQNLMIGALLGMAQPGFWSLPEGFQQLPLTLMTAAESKGVTHHLQHRLIGLRRIDPDDEIELTFLDSQDHTVVRYARKVIMSAPVSAFDRSVDLDGFDPGLTDRFARIRQGVVPIPAGKLYLVYPAPWWQDMDDLPPGADPLHGYANTDMPSRAIYYKGTIGDGRGIMTGALTDSISADFWSSFLAPDAELFAGTDERERRLFGAPADMVHTGHRLLRRMHQPHLPAPMPQPDLALYHEWRTEGAGWSAWKSGRNIHEDAAVLRLPFKTKDLDQGLYCCGDSVSERHGWVDNSLESAELMLREAFGLAPAHWLPDGSAA